MLDSGGHDAEPNGRSVRRLGGTAEAGGVAFGRLGGAGGQRHQLQRQLHGHRVADPAVLPRRRRRSSGRSRRPGARLHHGTALLPGHRHGPLCRRRRFVQFVGPLRSFL